MNNVKDDSISYMKVRTKGNSVPDRKPKVFFTCHPADFDIYFDSICADIFEAYDCAIYYTADMTASIPEIYRETDLGSMHLLVIPDANCQGLFNQVYKKVTFCGLHHEAYA